VLINTEKHVILETSHPSPFSAHRWFLWSQCFKQTNEILERNWNTPINWEIKDHDEQMSLEM
jgi:uracil-DNA glycosylase